MITGAKKLGVRVLVGLLVVAMAAFGIENFFLGSSSQSPLEVNGEELSQAMVDNAIQEYRKNLSSTYGQQFVDAMSAEFISKSAEKQLVQQVLLRQNAKDLQLTATNTMVNNYLVDFPQFQLDGKFSIEALQGYLTSNRVTLAQFQDNLRTSIGQQLLYDSFVVSQPVLHQRALDMAGSVLFASADVVYAQINDVDLVPLITADKEQVETYYRDHSGDYQQSAQARFSYLTLKVADFSADVAEPEDQQIAFAYQGRLAELSTKEEYTVSHILVSTNSKSEDEAMQFAMQLRARIDQGENFSDLASKHSEDSGSAEQGGSLGTLPLDSLVPEFSDQVRLMRSGEISQPVRSDFGYHIIRLDADPTSNAPTLEDLREELREELINSESQAAYTQALNKLRNLTGGASSLDAAAQELQLTIRISPEITRIGTVDSAVTPGLFGRPQVREAAFADQVIEQQRTSEVLDLGDVAIVVLRESYTPEKQLALDEVRDRVTKATRLELAQQRRQLLAMAITKLQPQLATLEDKRKWLIGDDWKSAVETDLDAQTLKKSLVAIKFVAHNNLQRQSVSKEQDPVLSRLSNLVYSAALKTDVINSDKASDNQLVYLVFEVREPDFASLEDEQQQQVRQSLEQTIANSYGSQLFVLLESESSITRNTQP